MGESSSANKMMKALQLLQRVLGFLTIGQGLEALLLIVLPAVVPALGISSPAMSFGLASAALLVSLAYAANYAKKEMGSLALGLRTVALGEVSLLVASVVTILVCGLPGFYWIVPVLSIIFGGLAYAVIRQMKKMMGI